VGLGLAGEDMISACRVLAKFSKDHANLKIKAAFLDGSLVMADRVKEIANIPSREILLTQIVTGIKSPITSFAGVLGGILRKFVVSDRFSLDSANSLIGAPIKHKVVILL